MNTSSPFRTVGSPWQPDRIFVHPRSLALLVIEMDGYACERTKINARERLRYLERRATIRHEPMVWPQSIEEILPEEMR